MGCNAELFDDPRLVEGFIAHGIEQGDVIVNQLREVFIAGGDKRLNALRCRALCERADHIVGFNARDD